MDTRAYVWLADNLDKYIYTGEGIKIRETILNLNITSESVRNSEKREAMDIAYSRFVENFGNNILTYKTGLGTGNISSKELDCYFIPSAEGMVPIGFYREIRPVETAIKVKQLIKENQEVAGESENLLLEDLTARHKKIQKQFEYIAQKEKSPNKVKVFLGGLLSLLALIFTVLVLDKLNVIAAIINGRIDLSDLWLFKDTLFIEGLVFAVILSMIISVFGVVILGVIFTIRESLLIKSKKITKAIAENMDEYVQKLKDESEDSIYQCKYLYEAAGKCERVRVEKHAVVSHIGTLVKMVEAAERFVAKTRTQRRGNDPALLYTLVGCIAVMALFNGPVDMGFNKGSEDVPPVVEVVTEREKVEPFTEDVTELYEAATELTGNYVAVDSCDLWANSWERAINDGGALVSINSREEFEYVCSLAEEEGLNGFWAGAWASEGIDWDAVRWEDGEAMTFTKWDYMENVKQEDEEYLLIYKVNDSEWYYRSVSNDGAAEYEAADSRNNIGFIIEYEDMGYEW